MNTDSVVNELISNIADLIQRVTELERRLDSVENMCPVNVDSDENNSSEEVTDTPDSQQLALLNSRVSPAVRELVAFTASQMGSLVYREVIEELNEKVVPQVTQMVNYVNYSLQDGQEIVDEHRSKLETQLNNLDPNIKLITDGRNDKRILSPYVRTVWGGPDEDSTSSDEQ